MIFFEKFGDHKTCEKFMASQKSKLDIVHDFVIFCHLLFTVMDLWRKFRLIVEQVWFYVKDSLPFIFLECPGVFEYSFLGIIPLVRRPAHKNSSFSCQFIKVFIAVLILFVRK